MTAPATSDLAQQFPAPEAFEQALTVALPGFGSIQWAAELGSTNDELTQRAKQGSGPRMPWLLGAHAQHRGKGRAGRPWQNTAGEALMFSCAFSPNIPLAQLPGLSPALGTAACLALRQLFAPLLSTSACRKLCLKWPNDIQWGDAKLAGILIETSQMPGARHPCVVAGIGINLHGAQTLAAQLNRDITDLSTILSSEPGSEPLSTRVLSPAVLVATIAQAWQDAFDAYAASGYAAFQERFNTVDALAARPVQVVDQGRVLHTGTAQGTDSIGRLLVASAAGVLPILVGDVSVRSPDVSVRGPASSLSATTFKGAR